MNENNANMSNNYNNNDYDYEVKKKSLFVLILLLFLLVTLVVGVSYQIYLYSTTGKSLINEIFGTGNDDIFSNGSVTIVYTEGEDSMLIENAIPMSDESGMKISDPNELMDFNVGISINRSSAVSFEVVAEKDSKSTLDNKNIRLYVQRGINKPTYEEEILMPTNFLPIEKEDDYGAPEGVMVLDQVTTSESATYYYRLRMWLDNKFVLDNTYKYFKIKVNVYGKGERIKGENANNNNNNGSNNIDGNNTNNDNNSDKNNNNSNINDNIDSNNSNTTPTGSTTGGTNQAY